MKKCSILATSITATVSVCGPVTHKVCSDNLFAVDKESGELKWNHAYGQIVNASITIQGNRIYFVECRGDALKNSPERRVGGPAFAKDQFLVAMDAETGAKLWERPITVHEASVVFVWPLRKIVW